MDSSCQYLAADICRNYLVSVEWCQIASSSDCCWFLPLVNSAWFLFHYWPWPHKEGVRSGIFTVRLNEELSTGISTLLKFCKVYGLR